MKHTKYIVYNRGGFGTDTMIIFGPTISHHEVAQSMGVLDNVVSAGFLQIGIFTEGEVGVHAYGGSDTLKIDSRPGEDTVLAKFTLFGWDY